MMRSIVTQPSNENYVYANSFAVLGQVKHLLLNLTCSGFVPDPLTTPMTTLPPASGMYCARTVHLTVFYTNAVEIHGSAYELVTFSCLIVVIIIIIIIIIIYSHTW